MAGTLTTTLVEGDPKVDSAVAGEALSVGDVVQYKSGSVDTLVKGTKSATLHKGELKVVKEFGSVEIDGSYPSGDRVQYYQPQRGDILYAETSSTKAADGDIAVGDYLGQSDHTDGALAEVANASGTVAIAHEVHGTATGTDVAKIKFEVL